MKVQTCDTDCSRPGLSSCHADPTGSRERNECFESFAAQRRSVLPQGEEPPQARGVISAAAVRTRGGDDAAGPVTAAQVALMGGQWKPTADAGDDSGGCVPPSPLPAGSIFAVWAWQDGGRRRPTSVRFQQQSGDRGRTAVCMKQPECLMEKDGALRCLLLPCQVPVAGTPHTPDLDQHITALKSSLWRPSI